MVFGAALASNHEYIIIDHDEPWPTSRRVCICSRDDFILVVWYYS